jgi:hypothetical protein
MVDADLLVRDHHSSLAAGYVAATLLAGLLAGYAGIAAGRVWPSGESETEMA